MTFTYISKSSKQKYHCKKENLRKAHFSIFFFIVKIVCMLTRTYSVIIKHSRQIIILLYHFVCGSNFNLNLNRTLTSLKKKNYAKYFPTKTRKLNMIDKLVNYCMAFSQFIQSLPTFGFFYPVFAFLFVCLSPFCVLCPMLPVSLDCPFGYL